jgi:hypothetical protein
MGAVFPTRTKRIMLAVLVVALVGELAFLAVSRLIAAGPLPAGCGFVPVALVQQLVPGGQPRAPVGGVWNRLCEWSTVAEGTDYYAGPPAVRGAGLRVHVERCHEIDHPDAGEYCQRRRFAGGLRDLVGIGDLDGIGDHAYAGYIDQFQTTPGAVWVDLFALRGPDLIIVEYKLRPSTRDLALAGAAAVARAVVAGVR